MDTVSARSESHAMYVITLNFDRSRYISRNRARVPTREVYDRYICQNTRMMGNRCSYESMQRNNTTCRESCISRFRSIGFYLQWKHEGEG